MSTDIEPMKDFEQKIKERLSKDITDLIPDEALTALVEKSIDRVFFKERITSERVNSWSNPKVTRHPSVFEETVADLLREPFEKIIARHMEENQDEIMELLNEILGNSWLDALAKAIRDKCSMEFEDSARSILQRLSSN